jgi:LuxR family maltose regulon positive regulatory protein
MALARADDENEFVARFHGTNRDVGDYLLSEVLQTVTHEDREFMIDTSVLRSLSGELCDAVTGRHDSADILDRLERTNAFVIPLGREGLGTATTASSAIY